MKKLSLLVVFAWLCLIIGFCALSGSAESAGGDFITSFASPIVSPMEIDYDAARGGVWIASDSGQIERVDIDAPYATQQNIDLVGIAINPSGEANGIAVLRNGNLLLSDWEGDLTTIDDYLFEIDPVTETLVNYWPLDGAFNTSIDGSSIDKVFGAEIGPNGHAYVTSTSDNTVHEIGFSPGTPGTWWTVAVHTATTVGNALGIDRISCPFGWWVSDFTSTTVAWLYSSFATIRPFAATFDSNSSNAGITSVDNKDPIEIWTADSNNSMIGIFDSGLSPIVDTVELLSPNGGENIPAGSIHKIQWCAPTDTLNFSLRYSLNNGSTWKVLANEYPDAIFSWGVPINKGNKTKSLVQVKAFDASGNLIGTDKSDAPFTIEVVKLTLPNGEEILTSGETRTITWKTNATKKPVAKVILFYTVNGGATWKKIAPPIIGSNPGSYDTTVPTVGAPKPNSKVRVMLKDTDGNILGIDASDDFFRIQPAPSP